MKDDIALPDAARPSVPTGALADIAAERLRQVEGEGWTLEHDDGHTTGEMACGAAAYAAYSSSQNDGSLSAGALALKLWPWNWSWWKPSEDRRRNLVKAGALIVAEIERLDRADTPPETGTGTEGGR